MYYLDTLRGEIEGMWYSFVSALPNFAIALLVLIATWLVAKSAVKIADKLIGKTSLREDLRQLIHTLARLLIWLAGIVLALIVAIPGFTPAGLIAGLGIGALAIGFAFQDIFENFLAGVLIMLREKMQIGDVIEVEGITGSVERITLRETYIRQPSNDLTVLPNAMLFKNPVRIFTDADTVRTEVVCGVAYDVDLPQAESVIRNAVEGLKGTNTDKPVEVYASSFGASSVDFTVRFWAGSSPKEGWQARSQAIKAIHKALGDAGIEIPFPYVTHTFKEVVPVGGAGDLGKTGE